MGRPPRRLRVNPLWKGVFVALYGGVRDQLLCCPLDEVHEKESAVFAYGSAILKLARTLSGDVEFRSFDELIADELFFGAKYWHVNQPFDGPEFHRIRAFTESPHRWNNWFRITVTGIGQPTDPQRVREARDRLHLLMAPIYARWRTQTAHFNAVYREEVRSYGRAILQGFLLGMQVAKTDPVVALVGTRSIVNVRFIRAAMEQTGASTEEAADLAIAYLQSDAPAKIPSVITRALLYAKQANLLRAGMRAPAASAANDIERLACVMPYCDAMLLERHFTAMLRELESEGRLPGSHRRCRVFSVRELDRFLEFIGSVRKVASTDHLGLAQRLYGASVPPFAD